MNTIRGIYEAGKINSILTASNLKSILPHLDRLGLSKYFEHVAGREDDLASGKINAGINILKKIDLDPGEVVLVGDTDHDWEVAEKLGISCYLLEGGHQSIERLSQTTATIVKWNT